MQSWVIGSSVNCDVVVDSPLVSGRHCQLTQHFDGFVLEDLGSTNGTYVDGNRITVATCITPAQVITLGQTVTMPWPSDLARSIRIGRIAGNDIVLDDPRVSGQHARLMIVAGSAALIEDLGSSNGTFLNSAEERVTRLTPLSNSDTVYFGSLAVPAARLLAGLLDVVAPVPVSLTPPTTTSKVSRPEPITTEPPVGFIARNRWLLAALAVLAQAPLLAFLIVVFCGRQLSAVTVANWNSVGQGIAATTFGLAIAAVWLGCSTAVTAGAGGLWPGRREKLNSEPFLVSIGSRLAALASLCTLGCALLLAIVYWGTGLKGPWLSMGAILVLESIVALLLGLLISTVARSWQAVAVVLIGSFALMTALGGWFWPLSGKGLPVSLAAGATPARWAFEGVLLLESPHHPSPATLDGSVPTPDRDLAEDYFPADFDRMGTQADAMALGSMLIGMAAAVVVLSGKPR